MTHNHLTNKKIPFTVSSNERWLIEELRKLPFGKVEITMADGQPDRIEKIRESVKYVAQ